MLRAALGSSRSQQDVKFLWRGALQGPVAESRWYYKQQRSATAAGVSSRPALAERSVTVWSRLSTGSTSSLSSTSPASFPWTSSLLLSQPWSRLGHQPSQRSKKLITTGPLDFCTFRNNETVCCSQPFAVFRSTSGARRYHSSGGATPPSVPVSDSDANCPAYCSSEPSLGKSRAALLVELSPLGTGKAPPPAPDGASEGSQTSAVVLQDGDRLESAIVNPCTLSASPARRAFSIGPYSSARTLTSSSSSIGEASTGLESSSEEHTANIAAKSSKLPPSSGDEPPVASAKGAGSTTKRGLRAVVREVLSTMPGGALVVMQQQHVVMRYLTVKLRAWRQARRSLRDSKARASGRRSRGRRRRGGIKTASPQVCNEPAAPSIGFLKEAAVLVKAPKPVSPDPSMLGVQEPATLDTVGRPLPQTTTAAADSALAALELQKEPSPQQQRVPPGVCVCGAKPTSQQVANDSVSTPSPQRPSSQDSVHDRSELLRNYEAVLNVVVSAGVVGLEEKRFLSEYRKRCGISQESHVESINRLGWTMKEFEAGHLMTEAHCEPRLRRMWRQFLEACDSKGNYIVTLGSLSSLLSITMSSMVHLRVLQVVAGFLYFTYNMTRQPPLLSAGYWNIVFFVINGFMLLRLFLESRPETFNDDELDLFDAYFLNTGLRPRQFKKLLAAAQWRTIPSGEMLVRQGEPVKHLTILCRGELVVSINDHEVERLTGGDSNAVIGIKTFLSKLQVDQPNHRDAPSGGAPSISLPAPATAGAAAPESANPPSIASHDPPPLLPPLDGAPLDRGPAPVPAAEPIASSTTVTATVESLVLTWPMDLLVERVKADPVNLGFALVAFMGKSLVHRSRSQSARQTFASYETVLQAVLTDGNVLSEERQLLDTCRQRFGISEEQHLELLDRFGWTPEEFDIGRKSGKSGKSSDFSRTWSKFFS